MLLITHSGCCGLNLYRSGELLDNNSNRITSIDDEEQIARRQVDDDLRLFGSRSEPTDVSKSAHVPSQRNVSEAGFNGPTRTLDNSGDTESNQRFLAAMDWNAGESPMWAWLNQSAIPLIPPARADLQDQTSELMEIEVFRNIHVATAPEPVDTPTMRVEDASDLELDAQIYYRNIVDRYPLLPVYLARRLAVANHNRAERLRLQRLSSIDPKVNNIINDAAIPRTENLQNLGKPSHALSSCGEQSDGPYFSCSASMADMAVEDPAALHSVYSDFWSRGSVSRRSSSVDWRSSSIVSRRVGSVDSRFSGIVSRRVGSVDSRSSSMNSSLRGYSQFDPQEQNEEIPNYEDEARSAYFGSTRRGLPQPPVGEIQTQFAPGVEKHMSLPSKRAEDKPDETYDTKESIDSKPTQSSFDCDICGHRVSMCRRQEWQ